MLDAMYDAELRPDGEVYEACAFACAAAKEWAWAVQLYEARHRAGAMDWSYLGFVLVWLGLVWLGLVWLSLV